MEDRLSDWSVRFLVILGVWLILAPLAPGWTGYLFLTELLGGESALARFFAGFLFLYFAGIVREKNEVRRLLRRLSERAKKGAPGGGGDPEQVRTAVDLLIQGLGSDRGSTRASALENLIRLTGQDLGEDRDGWKRWWAEHRDGFGV